MSIHVLERLGRNDPYPIDVDLPEGAVGSIEVLEEIERRIGMKTHERVQDDQETKRRNGMVVAAAFGVVLVMGIAFAVLASGGSGTQPAGPEPSTTTIIEGSTQPWSGVPVTADTVMVYGSWTDTSSTQTGGSFTGGVGVETYEYSESLELSDSRASGTTEYVSTVYTKDSAGTWFVEEVTLVNDAGTWTGYGIGVYNHTDSMPTALTTGSIVVTGEWHLIGEGAYEGLRLDFYSSSDGVIGTINPVG